MHDYIKDVLSYRIRIDYNMKSIELCDINTCTQCMSCVSVCPKQCIQMQPSEAGFKKFR